MLIPNSVVNLIKIMHSGACRELLKATGWIELNIFTLIVIRNEEMNKFTLKSELSIVKYKQEKLLASFIIYWQLSVE